MIQILSLLLVLLLTVEQCTTAAIQANHIVFKVFSSNLFIIETSQDSTTERDGINDKDGSKGDKGNLDHKDQQDQEMEVLSLLDRNKPPVL